MSRGRIWPHANTAGGFVWSSAAKLGGSGANLLSEGVRSAKATHQSNAVAERYVRVVEEGNATMIASSGLPEASWPDSSRYFAAAFNFKIGSDGTCNFNMLFVLL